MLHALAKHGDSTMILGSTSMWIALAGLLLWGLAVLQTTALEGKMMRADFRASTFGDVRVKDFDGSSELVESPVGSPSNSISELKEFPVGSPTSSILEPAESPGGAPNSGIGSSRNSSSSGNTLLVVVASMARLCCDQDELVTG